MFIHWMYENNVFKKDIIIYDTTDGYRKQYICADTIWLLSLLEFTYTVIVDILPVVNDKCPGFFSDFAGNSHARKLSKAQTNQVHINGRTVFSQALVLLTGK